MRCLLVLSIAGLSLTAGALVERAKAEQAFLCEGGRIVYARGGEVEQLKRTDACVAGYFGITLERGSERAAAQPAAPSEVRAPAIGAPAVAAPSRGTPPPEIRIINARPAEESLRTSSR